MLLRKFKAFASLLVVVVLLILARCAYGIDQLSGGNDGDLSHDKTSFVVLEGM